MAGFWRSAFSAQRLAEEGGGFWVSVGSLSEGCGSLGECWREGRDFKKAKRDALRTGEKTWLTGSVAMLHDRSRYCSCER